MTSSTSNDSRPSRTRPRRVLLALPLLFAACDPSSEEAFIHGLAYDPCLQTLPACPGVHASCTLDSSRYARVNFPGEFRFLVKAERGYEVEVIMFFAEQRDAGLDTRIYWYEPGCSDVYDYASDGQDLFELTGDGGVFAERREMLEGGEHLIEIFSDMRAEVLITVNVIVPGTE